jgi:hypothetical protein
MKRRYYYYRRTATGEMWANVRIQSNPTRYKKIPITAPDMYHMTQIGTSVESNGKKRFMIQKKDGILTIAQRNIHNPNEITYGIIQTETPTITQILAQAIEF